MPSLKDLGEVRIVEILERTLGINPRTIIPFHDDVSAIPFRNGLLAILKTDMLVGSTDIPLGMSLRQAARKAVVANVSDLAAKGVRPVAGMVSLGLPRKLTKNDVLDIGRGLRDASRLYKFRIVGGDTSESKDLTIAIALYAVAKRSHLILRSGAKTGDVVAATGPFGSTSAGLKSLLVEGRRPAQLPRALYDAVYNPKAELALGSRFASLGAVTASIDSSDGLACSLHELARSSRVGFLIDQVPVSKAATDFAKAYGYDEYELALYGGEEYNLVVTVNPVKLNIAQRAARGKLIPIGIVTRKGTGVRLKKGDSYKPIPRKGWEHFKQ